ncbi:hypothetical protein SCUCBS95973_004899 [Sporothrix curviconia]|uniref:Initiation-specific alpha-1,6-mannosyltransferase n=1 Tax=Sporothrix curviconia TaxID=1260050 RepID=A0ABP0BSK9_9PEZI
MEKYRIERQHMLHEKQQIERSRHALFFPRTSSTPETMLPRWTDEGSARIGGEDKILASPTRAAAAFLMRPRFAGARFRRLLIALASLVVISICVFHFSPEQRQLLAVPDGMRHRLPWNRPSSDTIVPTKDGTANSHFQGELTPVDADKSVTDATTRLPHIPAKIWQIYLDFKPNALSVTYLTSWLFHSPSYSYTILDKAGAHGLVSRLAGMANTEGAERRVPIYPDIVVPPAQTPVEAEAEEEDSKGDTDDADDKNDNDNDNDNEKNTEEGGDEEKKEKKDEVAKRGKHQPHVELRESSPVQMKDLAFARDALQQYDAMPRRVLRADFLRYLVLALEGGVYSDVDTYLVRDIRDWVPEAFRAETRLIVGLEADSSPAVTGTTYEVQFCQWTLSSAADHPTMWTMLDRILAKVRTIDGSGLLGGTKKLTDKDVLAITGPAAWTEVVFEHLDQVAGTGVGAPRITWETLTGMKEPKLYGDTLVLPIDGFATGVPHSHASQAKSEQTLVKHQFQGKWRDDKG